MDSTLIIKIGSARTNSRHGQDLVSNAGAQDEGFKHEHRAELRFRFVNMFNFQIWGHDIVKIIATLTF